jgi:hypothetical protein
VRRGSRPSPRRSTSSGAPSPFSSSVSDPFRGDQLQMAWVGRTFSCSLSKDGDLPGMWSLSCLACGALIESPTSDGSRLELADVALADEEVVDEEHGPIDPAKAPAEVRQVQRRLARRDHRHRGVMHMCCRFDRSP